MATEKHSLIQKGKMIKLTPREVQVLTLYALHGNAKKVAQELQISHRTVETRLFLIRSKMGVSTSFEATQLIIDEIFLPDISPVKLTPREYQVLEGIKAGDRNKDIGQKLKISGRAAMFHVNSIIKKSGLKNRYRVGLYALKHPNLFICKGAITS